MASEIRVRRAPVLRGEIRVPGDKSISHRAVLIASLSNGACEVDGFLAGEDCQRTIDAMRTLGVKIEQPEPQRLIIHGRGGDFKAPHAPIYCGNSGTTMRLLAGLLAAQPFKSRLIGDESLSRRPMGRIIEPLTAMGARIQARELLVADQKRLVPPLDIEGGKLEGISWKSNVASAQVKSAILLAGLFARGTTTVIEPARSRDHTERMLEHFLVPVRRHLDYVSVCGGVRPESRDFHVPGDISSAAFWLAAAAAQPGAHLIVQNVGLNETRTGINAVLLRMGAALREVISSSDATEPSGTIELHGGQLHGTIIENTPRIKEIPSLIDEIPILAVAGALAQGTTIFRDIEELRVKETDRIDAIVKNLRLMGARVEDGVETDQNTNVSRQFIRIFGGMPLTAARIPSYGDHRIAMAFAIAGLFAEGETVIEDTDCIQTSYPNFQQTLNDLTRPKGVRSIEIPVVSNVQSLSISGGGPMYQ